MVWRSAVLLLSGSLLALAQSQPPSKPPGTALESAREEFQLATRELGLRPDSQPLRKQTPAFWTSWHGRLFHNFRNDKLDATPHEVVQRGGSRNILRRNQFGFNAGGPLVIPRFYDGSRRTFLNVSYEGVRERIGRSFLRTVAIQPERGGDFSATVDPAGNPLPVYDPAATRPNSSFNPLRPVSRENLEFDRAPFPGNRIPPARLDPVALRAVSFYPLANASAGPFFRNNYFVFAPEGNEANGMIFKIDHTQSDRHRFTFNGSFTEGLASAPRLVASIADPGNNDRQYSARRGTLDWTFTRNATTVNTLTFDAIADRAANNRPGESEAVSTIGIPGPLSGGFPYFRFTGYLPLGRPNPNTRYSHAYYYLTDGFSTRLGKHRLRATAQFRHYQIHAFLPNYPAGQFQFGPGLTSLPGIVNTGHEFASFLLGQAEFASATLVEHPSYWRANFYRLGLGDNWDFSKTLNFSLNLGLSVAPARYEKFNRFSSVSLDALNPANGLPGAMVFAARDGQGRSLQRGNQRPDLSFGMAWNPGGNAKGVLRLSYGLSFGAVPVYTTQWASQGFYGNPTLVSPNLQLQPAATLARGMPPLERTLPDLRPDVANFTVADLVEPRGTVPLYQSAGLSLEREIRGNFILSLNLSHARGQRLFVTGTMANPNAIPLQFLDRRDALNSEAFRRQIRPYPQFQRFNLFSSWPTGNYKRNAASVRVEKRSSAGLSANASYEFSKQMDDYSGPYGIQDFYNMRNEWSLTSSNNPHRLAMTLSYELPFGSRKSLLAYQDWRRHLVDGWTLSSISSVQSGEPLALRPQFNNTGTIIEALRVNLVPGVEPAVPHPDVERWFNPAAFSQPPDFSPGNGPRTHPQLLGPGSQNHDLSVSKRFALSPERVIELTATGFNFTNTGNYADPDVVIGPASAPNANSGRINETRGGRVIQVGLRLSF